MRLLFLITLLGVLHVGNPARGGRGGRKKGAKGKSTLQFGNVDEYSLEAEEQRHPQGAVISKGTHWTQVYRLGFKLVLICIANGKPRPAVTWYKDGAELYPAPNAHHYENRTGLLEVFSKIEIDPGSMGDQGIYSCLASNSYGMMVKNFRAEYTY